MGAISWLICVSVLVTAGDESVRSQANEARARSVAQRIHEHYKTDGVPDADLEIRVRRNTVLVTGIIEDPAHARLVVDAVAAESGVKTIQLNLGVGQAPEPLRTDPLHSVGRRELKWDDGHWLKQYPLAR